MRIAINYLLASAFFISANLFGQTKFSGNVSDEDSGLALAGVNVLVKGTNTGTSTDFDGNYVLNAEIGDVIIFSYVGFASQEIMYNGEDVINILMSEDASALDEVVLIGYGSVKKQDLTGAADLITSDDFNEGPILSAQQLISGKVAGVSITSGSGAPGDGQVIRIRGNGSLSLSSSPLFVVDGIPLNDGGVGGSRNPLNVINPNDIESMVILKDASATAIYGSRAANGVIIITTKSSKSGEFKYQFSSATTTYSAVDKVDVLSADSFRDLLTQLVMLMR